MKLNKTSYFKIVGRDCTQDIESKEGDKGVIVKKGAIINWEQAKRIADENISERVVCRISFNL